MRVFLFLTVFWSVCASAGRLDFLPQEVKAQLQSVSFLEGIEATGATPCMVALIRDNVLANGKRVRPILVYLGAGIAGAELSALKELSIVAELNHNASLVHDDFLDGDSERRGVPSVVAASSPSQAILLGDFLMAWASKRSAPAGLDAHNAMMDVIMGMATGEFLQKQVIDEGGYGQEDWNRIAELKTGKLFGWSLSVGARFGRVDLVDELDAIGRELGILFQLRDDIDDTTEFGEINFVHQQAAEMVQGSPFSRADIQVHLETANLRANAHLRERGRALQQRVQKLSARTAPDAETIEKRSQDALVALIDLIIAG